MVSKQIAANLSLSEGTVNNHINATMRALKVSTRTHAVTRALELGLIGVDASHTGQSAESC
jgi:two-component system response regulator DesR